MQEVSHGIAASVVLYIVRRPVIHSPWCQVCLDGLLRDGITAQSFYEVIYFAYTGDCALVKNTTSTSCKSWLPYTRYRCAIPSYFSLPPVDGKWADSGDGERHAVMNVLVAANRFGFKVLAQQCERKLSLNLEYVKKCKIIPTLSIFWNELIHRRFSTLVVQECLQFALAYNLTRLEKQCTSTLKRKSI